MWWSVLCFVLGQAAVDRVEYVGQARSLDCGNAYYDCDQSNGEVYDPPGSISNPDWIHAVRFDPSDFGFGSGVTYIYRLCIADFIDATIAGVGPFSKYYVYPDLNGLPDENVILGEFLVPETGNGTYEIDFRFEPISVTGPFWVAHRGDPMFPAESLGTEICEFPPAVGHSYVSTTGVAHLFPLQYEEFVIHTELSDQRPVLPVPTMSSHLRLLMAFLGAAICIGFIRMTRNLQ